MYESHRHTALTFALSLFALGLIEPAVSPARHAPASAHPAESPVLAESPIVDWKLLSELNVDNGKATAALKNLDGHRVRIAAFIVPLEDDLQQSDEFLLVPYFGACIHTPPPPPNQMIYVKMTGHKTIKIRWQDPVMFEGVLHIWRVDSPYGDVSYDMDGIASTPYVVKRP